MGCCATKQASQKHKDNNENTFVAMDQKKVYTKATDVVATVKDFVVEYQDMSIFSQKYSLHQSLLGKGAYGSVKKATQKSNNEMRAVKIIDKLVLEDQDRIRLKYEIDILKNLLHPNIVRLYEVYENKSNIFLVTELCDGCELFEEISQRKTFGEQQAAAVTKQILNAIAYCHGKQIAHRDLKPENILIDVSNAQIKVIDFGTSHHFNQSQNTMHQMYGTPYYIAPEVLQGTYTEKCDIWSIGVILYIMLCGQPPFVGSDDQILTKVKKGTWSFKHSIWGSISDDAKDLITKLMDKNVNTRLTAVEALAHPWIASTRANYNKDLAAKAIDNLSSFKNESKLKQATLTFMAGHLSTKKQQRELRKSFNQFDENGDGLIQRHEFLKAYRRLYPTKDQAEIDERANEIFDQADVDGTGDIDFGEWCTATINKNAILNEANLRAAFTLFDKDGGGTIEAEEIAAILGHNIAKEESVWQDVIKEVDVNGDGQINYDEFKTMMLKLASQDDEPNENGGVKEEHLEALDLDNPEGPAQK